MPRADRARDGHGPARAQLAGVLLAVEHRSSLVSRWRHCTLAKIASCGSGSPVLDIAAYHDSTGCCQLAEVAAEIGVIDNCIGWRSFAEPGYTDDPRRWPGPARDRAALVTSP